VSWALEASHIGPYKDSHSDSPSNGLLLRRDLHALFDSGHLAVDLRSRRIYLSSEAQEWEDYATLHGTVLLASPQPGFEKDAPNSAALRRRWQRFKKQSASEQ
jgi:putative restriction endonuclease